MNSAIGLNNYATGENSRYPELWRGCVGALAMCLGPTGSRLHDFSGRQNWGTLTNMDPPTDWVVSGGQYALDFDGADDIVSLGTMPSGLQNLPLSNFSISFFCNPRSQGENSLGTVIDCYETGAAGWYVLLRGVSGASYAIQMGVKFLTTDLTHISGNDVFTANKWDNLTLVYRNASKDLLLYRNGVSISFPQTSASSGAYNDDRSQQLRVGNRNAGDRTWDGQLDDIRLYSRALSEAEIKLLASRRGIAYERRRRRRVNEQAAAAALNAIYATRQTQLIGGGLL